MIMPASRAFLAAAVLVPSVLAGQTPMQAAQAGTPPAPVALPASAFTGLAFDAPASFPWPANAVAGSARRPKELFLATVGGVFKSTDLGANWKPVGDRQLHAAAVGAIAVAPTNADTIYLGTGDTRGNRGDGVYRSIDGGTTWLAQGLAETGVIARVLVHPEQSGVAWVAALGNPQGRSQERGVYRTLDAGRTWTKLLFRGDSVGAADLALDARHPDVLLAALWSPRRSDAGVTSGAGSALYKSTDGGDSWRDLTRASGLPAGFGRMALAIADSQRVYALVEHASAGGVYVSNDGGASWTRGFADPVMLGGIREAARVVADPTVRDRVWVVSGGTWRSDDGGRRFTRVVALAKVEVRDAWLAPGAGARLALAVPGGALVSEDGGTSWPAPVAADAARGLSRDAPRAEAARRSRTAPARVSISPVDAAVRWGVTADGHVQLSRDGGRTWTAVNVPVRAQGRVTWVAAGSRAAGSAWAAGNRLAADDRAAYIWKTSDFGATWTFAGDGLHEEATAWAVRDDPARPGLTFAGTEHGLAMSLDDGAHWQGLPGILPDLAVTDLVVEPQALRVTTRGRGTWTLGDVDVLRQLTPDAIKAPLLVLAPAAERRAPSGTFYFHLPRDADAASVEVLDGGGAPVRRAESPPHRQGLNRVEVSLGGLAPGAYQLRVMVGRESRSVPFQLVAK